MLEKPPLHERKFTSSEVAAITDVNIETLRVWRRRKHFKLEGEGQGWTRFTLADVMKIATFNALVQSFCTHELAEVVAANSGEQYAKILRMSPDDGQGIYLVCGRGPDGDVIFDVVQGVDELLTAVSKHIKNSEAIPTYHVVDYAAILAKFFKRLEELDK